MNHEHKIRKKMWIIVALCVLVIPLMLYNGWGPINPAYTLRSPDKILDYAYLTTLSLIDSKGKGDRYGRLLSLEAIQEAYHKIGNYPKSVQTKFMYGLKLRNIPVEKYSSGFTRVFGSADFQIIKEFIAKGDLESVRPFLGKDGLIRIFTLIQMANYHIDRGERNKATEYLTMAYDESLKLEENWKDYFWDEIAFSLGKIGKLKEAYALIDQRYDKSNLYSRIIPILAKYGNSTEAFRLLSEIPLDYKVRSMIGLAEVYHETGQKLNDSQVKVLRGVLQEAKNSQKR